MTIYMARGRMITFDKRRGVIRPPETTTKHINIKLLLLSLTSKNKKLVRSMSKVQSTSVNAPILPIQVARFWSDLAPGRELHLGIRGSVFIPVPSPRNVSFALWFGRGVFWQRSSHQLCLAMILFYSSRKFPFVIRVVNHIVFVLGCTTTSGL